jgi:hypothetical protein
MILIGGSGQNTGKTVLAEALIRIWKGRFFIGVLKVTTVSREGAGCQRGGAGCGVCSNLAGADFALEPELAGFSGKDTARLLKAGADSVFWLRSRYSALAAGFSAFLQKVPQNALLICESNSLREIARPGCFVMLLSEGPIKPTAERVRRLADAVLPCAQTPAEADRLAERIAVEQDPDGIPRAFFPSF